MTWLGAPAIAELLGGISRVLGGAAPTSPTPALPPAPPYPGTTPQSPPYPGMPWPSGLGDGLDGAAADAARQVDDALQNNHSAINDADAQLTEAILRASASDQQGKAQLQSLQRSVVDEVKNLGPSLDTPAGQQQLADFMQGKTAEILDAVKTAGLDASSHSAVLDALAARFRAVGDQRRAGSGGQSAPNSPTPADTDAARPSASTGAAGGPTAPATAAPAAAEPLGDDPLLDGLASDPLMAGLGPGLGGLGGLPAMMGPMMPFGGGGLPFAGMGSGGLPLGDLGAAIGGAIRDTAHGGDSSDRDDAMGDRAVAATDPRRDQPAATADPARDQPPATAAPAGNHPAKADPWRDQPAKAGPTQGHDTATPAPLKDQKNSPEPRPPAGTVSLTPPGPADTAVTLPDGTSVSADSPALAKAARAVIAGADITDAYQQAGIALSAPGTPVTAPVSPSKLGFGDVGQFTDHRVMALGGGKVWVNGQVSALSQLDTGPNFLGWEHPAELSTAAGVSAK
jgi:Domain of unknown function (DUF4226)